MKSDSRAGLRIAKLSQLTQDPHNANKGTERGTAMIERSLRQYGAGRSILVDRKGRVIAGNKTLEQARAAGLRELLLVPSDGRKLIAVQRTDLDLNRDKHARELAIADNRAGELNLEWDSVILQELAKDMDLEPFFSARELSEIAVNGGGDEGPEPQLDRAEELRAKWNTAPGQIWRIPSIKTPRREHRLMCGDSTKAEDVRLLMDTARAGLMNTDPPYGIGYAALKDGMPGSGFRNIQARYGDIRNDDLNGPELQRFLEEMIRAAVPLLCPNPAFYLWHPMLTQATFFAAAAAADILIHRQIIWVKPHMVLSRSGQYHWKHELCFYGWIRGKPCAWYGDKSQVSVWEIGESQQGRLHPTQKPVELFRRPIFNHTVVGDSIYEPFAGSGPQFIAAEQTGRLCYGLEIEPKYVAVTLQRLADMGLKPAPAGPAQRSRRPSARVGWRHGAMTT